MASHRVGRASEEIKKELADVMRSLKDPRLGGMLSIVHIDLASDYSYCTVHISSLEGLEQAKQAVKGLESAAGFIRRELSKRLKIRRVPEFSFIADDGIAYGAEIGKKILDLKKKKAEDSDGN